MSNRPHFNRKAGSRAPWASSRPSPNIRTMLDTSIRAASGLVSSLGEWVLTLFPYEIPTTSKDGEK